MKYVLNVPVLTEYGTYKFEKVNIDIAKQFLADDFTSAVGHQGTADVLSKILEINIPFNRVAITMKPNDKALVFRLKTRLAEGTVLTADELSGLDYDLAILTRVA
jgi:hypothetical protein